MFHIKMKCTKHFLALLIKNCYCWKRKLFGSILEILVPVLLVSILILIKATNSDKSEQVKTDDKFLISPVKYLISADQSFSLCSFYQSRGGDWGYGFVKNNDLTEYLKTQLAGLVNTAKLTPVYFDSESDLFSYVRSQDYEKKIKLCFAVQIEKFSEDVIEYSFRSNSSYVGSKKSRFVGSYVDVYNFHRKETISEALQESDPNYFYQYLSSGYLEMTNLVGNYIIQKNNKNKEIISYVQAMPNTEVKKDSFLLIIKLVMAICSYIAYLVPMCRMISAILKEREDRAKELLLIMGVSNNCYWLSWLLHYFCVFTTISLLISGVLVLGILKQSSYSWIFFSYWLFGLFCLFYCQLVSIFFTKSKNAILVSIVFYMVSFLSGYAFNTSSNTTKTLASLIPCIGFHFATDCFFDLEIINLGLQTSSVSTVVKNFSIINIFLTFPISILVTLTASAYFEQVMPSGYIAKKWNFCFRPDYCKKRVARDKTVIEESIVVGEYMEGVDPALDAQKRSKQAMMIRNLSKNFGSRKILKNISLDLYEGQIFSLLGHNGSGKTTTISILTGVLPATTGEVSVGECLLSENIEEIREMMGICLQENILFSILTPYEHIKIFAVLKGLKLRTISQDFIHEKLAEVKLLEVKDTPSGNLSGGQKRKLCLAIALLGESKIVILDEPTSGMDLNSRRHVWDLLKNNKNERIIILTTHYMEEADILSDRVAMLIDGTVKCCGSPLYLKSQFGGGYYLSLLKTHNVASKNHSEKIINFIESSLPYTCEVVNDLHSEITFQLPFEFAKNCLHFFKELEVSLEGLSLRGYSISVTTIEEVFMKVMQTRTSHKFDMSHRMSLDDTFLGSELSPLKISEKRISRCNQICSVVKKRAIISKRDFKSTLIEIFSPLAFLILAFLLMSWNPVNVFPTKLSFDRDLSGGLVAYDSGLASDELVSYIDLNFLALSPLPAQPDLTVSSDLTAALSFEDLAEDSLFINFTLYPNQKILHSSAYNYHKVVKGIVASLGIKTELRQNNFPLPPTKVQSSVYSMGSGLVLIIGLGIGFSFVPSSIALFISKERELGIKHLHRISGLDSKIYWIGNFIWDLFKHLITVGFSICFISLADFTMLKGDSSYLMASCLIACHSLSSTFFSYFLTFLSSSSSTTNVNSLIIHILSGSFLPNLFMIVLNFPSLRGLMYYILWFSRLLPNFSLNWGFMRLANKIYIAVLTDSDSIPNDFDIEGSLPDLLMMFVQIAIFSFGIYIAEVLEVRPYLCTRRPKLNNVLPVVVGYDEDIEKEAQVAHETDPNDVVVNIKSLSKIFNSKKNTRIAVDDISLNIYKGECFSILGVNGAGKTTTFKILTGTIAPTDGLVYVHGFNVKTQINKVRENIGYCPQHDVINDMLTARETLKIYADFRGIPRMVQGNTIDKVIDLVGLNEHADFVCGHYSGGNKRKLCLGIAILGFPELVILDEPTAGMDPESRKRVWRVLTELKSHQCSVMLTSHSMDEAENVSDRISIMTSGKLRCIGSPSYIKQKFGDDFELQLKLENPTQFEIYDLASSIHSIDKSIPLDKTSVGSVLKELDCIKYFSLINQRRSGSAIYWTLEKKKSIPLEDLLSWLLIERLGDQVIEFLRENFDEVKIEEHYLTFFKIKIINDENISLGGIFNLIEINKKSLKIAGYSLSQTTLDQIFNRFANNLGSSGVYGSSATFQSKLFSFGMTRLSDKP